MPKIIRQPDPNRSAWMSSPATTGPSTADRPISGPKTPHAFLVSAGPNRSRVSPKPCGSITAPHAPCTIRAVISVEGDCAAAHTIEVRVKPPIPASSTRLRPYMSPSRPPVSSATAIASVYPAAIHWRSAYDPPRPARIEGAATLATVESSRSITLAASTAM